MASGGFSYTPSMDNESSGKKFFPVCVDNFFDDPDFIREFALSLPMQPDPNGAWPGSRTDFLHNIDREFWQSLMLKALSSYYDLKYSNIVWDDSKVSFQLIPPWDGNKNDPTNVGWIHKDLGDDLAGLIYLTPDADPDSGTSLFNLKPEWEHIHLDYNRQPAKHMWQLGDKISREEYIKELEEHNNKFYEKTRFQNIYNRLIMYDSSEYHRANNFYTGNNDRLTCVFFLKGVKAGSTEERTSRYPQNRVVDAHNFDDRLKSRIRSLRGK